MSKFILVLFLCFQLNNLYSQSDTSKLKNNDEKTLDALMEDNTTTNEHQDKDKNTAVDQKEENTPFMIGDSLANIVKLIADYKSFKELPTSSFSQIDEKRLKLLDKARPILENINEEIDKVKDSTLKLEYKKETKIIKDNLYSLDSKKAGKISLIGNAAILNSNTTNGSAVNGTGSIGVTFSLNDNTFLGKAFLVLLSSPDTIISSYNSEGIITNSEEFGRSIVNPFSGSKSVQSGYLEFRKYVDQFPLFPFKTRGLIGFQGHIGYSNRLWLDSGVTATDTVNQQITTNILAGSIGIFYNPLRGVDSKIKNDLSLYIDLGITGRFLYGDIRYDNSAKMQLLGTDQVDYWGLELGFELKFKGFAGFITFPALFSTGGVVKGLTAGQFVGGFSISTSVFDFDVEN